MIRRERVAYFDKCSKVQADQQGSFFYFDNIKISHTRRHELLNILVNPFVNNFLSGYCEAQRSHFVESQRAYKNIPNTMKLVHFIQK